MVTIPEAFKLMMIDEAKKLEAENCQLKAEKKSLESEAAQMRLCMRLMTEENNTLKHDNATLTASFRRVNDERMTLLSEAATLRDGINKLNEENERLIAENKSVHEVADKLVERSEKVIDIGQRIADERDDAFGRCGFLSREVTRLQEVVTNQDKQNEHMAGRNIALRAENERLAKHSRELISEVLKLKEKNDSLSWIVEMAEMESLPSQVFYVGV